MAGGVRWCDHVAPATAVVACSGERHRVTWRRGKVVLEDHDLGAERAMLAFGAEPCACMRVLKAWRDQFGMPPELFRQFQERLGPQAEVAPPELGPVSELAMALNWQRDWKRLSGLSKHGRLLSEQLRTHALPALRQHLSAEKRRLRCRMIAGIEVEAAFPGAPCTLTGHMDSVAARASATLDARWLVEVWARGVAVVDGHFVLEIEREGTGERAGTIRVWAVRWERDAEGTGLPVEAPAIITTDAGGAHHLAWDDEAGSAAAAGAPGHDLVGQQGGRHRPDRLFQ